MCIVIAFVLTIFCVVKTFQMSDSDKECCLLSYTSLSAMKYFSLLLNKDNLYQAMDLKCNKNVTIILDSQNGAPLILILLLERLIPE